MVARPLERDMAKWWSVWGSAILFVIAAISSATATGLLAWHDIDKRLSVIEAVLHRLESRGTPTLAQFGLQTSATNGQEP